PRRRAKEKMSQFRSNGLRFQPSTSSNSALAVAKTSCSPHRSCPICRCPPEKARKIPFPTMPISALGDDLVKQVKLVSAAEISIPSTPVPQEELLGGDYVVNYHNTCNTPRFV